MRVDLNNSKIAFTEDIIKEVAKELDLPKKKIKYLYYTLISYLKYLVSSTSAVAIFIPFIGTFHVKVGFLFEKLYTYRNNKERYDIFKSKKDIIDIFLKDNMYGGYKGKPRHLERSKINHLFYNGGKSIYEIEKLQNEEKN